MQKHFMAWRVHAEWMENQVSMPSLPFEWVRGPKSQPPHQPDYPCSAIVHDSEAAYEAVRAAFAGGLHAVRIVPSNKATAAEWHRLKHEPGAVHVLPDQQGLGPGIG